MRYIYYKFSFINIYTDTEKKYNFKIINLTNRYI